MFDEDEPGKPRNWGWTIGIIVGICLVNLVIFVVIRAILDWENDFDEPIVDGQLRDDLTWFLGIFAMSFCFGCWCCFCCMGNCFKWATFCFHSDARERMINCWSSAMKQKGRVVEQIQEKKPSIAKKFSVLSRRERNRIDDFEDNIPAHHHSGGHRNTRIHPIHGRHSPRFSPKNHRRVDPRVHFDVEKGNGVMANHRRYSHSSQTSEESHMEARRKSNQWMEIQRPSTLPSEINSPKIGVHNVDYYEIPVSLMTPNTVAIVNPAFADPSNWNGELPEDREMPSGSSANNTAAPQPTQLESPQTPQLELNGQLLSPEDERSNRSARRAHGSSTLSNASSTNLTVPPRKIGQTEEQKY